MIETFTDTPDKFDGDVAVGPLYADRPPTRGLAGWTDWLLGEPLAALLIDGKVKARPGEKVLLASRPPFRAAKLVLVGCAAPAADKKEAERLAEQFADAVAGLGARAVLVESPFEDPKFFADRFVARLGKQAPERIATYVPETPCRI